MEAVKQAAAFLTRQRVPDAELLCIEFPNGRRRYPLRVEERIEISPENTYCYHVPEEIVLWDLSPEEVATIKALCQAHLKRVSPIYQAEYERFMKIVGEAAR